jgi:hypothetical protein
MRYENCSGLKKITWIIVILLCTLLTSCAAVPQYAVYDYSEHDYPYEELYITKLADPALLKRGKPVYALYEPVDDWSMSEYTGVKKEAFNYDVRGRDAGKLDFDILENYGEISFNTKTVWQESVPDDFHPNEILEFNKNPGLGIRELQAHGIDGSGVGIAIIDLALLLEHQEYKEKLMYYERIHCIDDTAQMHGPAVASIAVGETVGVAPGAKLYYIATTFGHVLNDGSFEFDFSILADCIKRVLEINEQLSQEDKIRVISVSVGYMPEMKGYEELREAMRLAQEQGILVLTVATEDFYPGFYLNFMARDYDKDPDDPYSYRFPNVEYMKDRAGMIMVPAGSRAYASCLGSDDYEFVQTSGASWAVPWCAGLYALCCQVKPDITPQEFIELMYETGMTIQITQDGKTYRFGKIADPAAMLEQLSK